MGTSSRALNVAVQMDHPSRLNPRTDTSVMLVEEAHARGHQVFFYEATELSWRAGILTAPLAPIHIQRTHHEAWYGLGELRRRALTEMDVILMRQDPPFDMSYITATHLLEQVQGKVAVWNDPAGVRNAPEKLSSMAFAAFMPPTLISRNLEEITEFLQNYESVVAKPLYGYGGRSVFKFAREDSNRETFLEFWREHSKEPLMWQEYLPQVVQADRRIVMLDGEVVSVFGRVPTGNSIRANMRVGGMPVKAELTPRQREICNAVGPFLRENGLLLTGLDVIGDYLTEINVTSPTGLRAAQALYGVNLAATFWDKVEAKL